MSPEAPALALLPFIHLGSLSLPTYYLINSCAACLSIGWLYIRSRQNQLSQTSALDGSFLILIAGFVGARIAHVVYEEPAYYLEDPLRILQFWRGGFIFYGGLIAGYLAGLWYFVKKETQILLWHDTFAPVIALGYAVGRLGCFLEGCCYGKVCQLPWGVVVKYTTPNGMISKLQHPTQIYASLWEGCALIVLLLLERRKQLPAGHIFWVWLGLHGLGRILMEVYRADPRGPQWQGWTLSLCISLLFVGLSGFFLITSGDKLRKS